MGNPFDNYDFESEFNYLMEMFNHPYKEMTGMYRTYEQSGNLIKQYDFGTEQGMREYYFEQCCGHVDIDLHQRVSEFLIILVKTTTYPVFQHIANSIVWDLQNEMDEIKGATNN